MDEDRARLERELTPDQLKEYAELRGGLKRELTDQIASSLGGVLKGFGVGDDFAHGFNEGFRDAVATGGATQKFQESMEEETDGKGSEAPEEKEEGHV